MQVPAPFDYARASSIDDALGLLERLGPEARLVAGGHSLLPMMKLRLATPEHLIDINPLSAELEYIREEGGEMRIGALTRHREILESDELARRLPILRDAERLIADPPVRNRGTLGGALCQADPVDAAADLRLRHLADLEPEGHVAPHREVLERGVVLEHEADVAPLGEQVGGVGALDLDGASSACSRPAMMRSSVDLPPPLGPSSAVSWPVGMSRRRRRGRRSRRIACRRPATSMLMGAASSVG